MERNPSFLTSEIHQKAWGHEEWIINSPSYCLKYLYFNKFKEFSLHFHLLKEETWTVDYGLFLFKWIDTNNATCHTRIIQKGDIIHIPKAMPHQLTCIEAGKIIEVSTEHFENDSYRISPGDSQKRL